MESHREIPIFLYIGYIEGTKKMLKLHANRIRNPEKIKIGNQTVEAMEFLSNNLKVSFDSKSENPEMKVLTMNKAKTGVSLKNDKPENLSKSAINSSLKGEKCLLM